MTTQQNSVVLNDFSLQFVLMYRHWLASDGPARVFQAAIALYLLPVLLIVLVVGGLGMLILECGRLLKLPAKAPLGQHVG